MSLSQNCADVHINYQASDYQPGSIWDLPDDYFFNGHIPRMVEPPARSILLTVADETTAITMDDGDDNNVSL